MLCTVLRIRSILVSFYQDNIWTKIMRIRSKSLSVLISFNFLERLVEVKWATWIHPEPSLKKVTLTKVKIKLSFKMIPDKLPACLPLPNTLKRDCGNQ